MDRFRAPAAATLLFSAACLSAHAGDYSGPTDTAHAIDPGIPFNSGLFTEWADAIDATRTYFAPGGSTTIDESGGFNSLGELGVTEIANGDSPGYITVTFPTGIGNGAGHDFAVFENGFVFPSQPHLFAELAFVEVSSNGTDFARFDAISTNTTYLGSFGQAFGGFDVTNVYNLAGKHAEGLGTPFDLEELAADPLVTSGAVRLDQIQYVRLVDIPGNGSFTDSLGNPILDAWQTTGTGGFDFRLGEGLGVGVINQAAPPIVLGDFNGDGSTTNVDIAPFVMALQDPSLFASLFPGVDPLLVGDFNADDTFSHDDIPGFVDLLTGGNPSALEELLAVPEPASGLLLAAGFAACIRRSRRGLS